MSFSCFGSTRNQQRKNLCLLFIVMIDKQRPGQSINEFSVILWNWINIIIDDSISSSSSSSWQHQCYNTTLQCGLRLAFLHSNVSNEKKKTTKKFRIQFKMVTLFCFHSKLFKQLTASSSSLILLLKLLRQSSSSSSQSQAN